MPLYSGLGISAISATFFRMIILPAIDLMDGEAVRLKQGKKDQKTVYSSDPPAFAKQWQDQGGEYIHLVDLDAAFEGSPKNLEIVRAICDTVDVPCELGGGIRDMDILSKVFDAGITRAIIGTKAAQQLEFVEEAVKEYGSKRIAVGIDAKDGRVATKGWVETTELDAFEFARAACDAGAGTIIYTDISTDGMLAGPNLTAQARMQETVDCQLIASGGVSKKEDVAALAGIDDLYGVIIGKALYDNKLTLAEALEAAE